MLQYRETPIQEIQDTTLKNAGLRLLVKREDLNHPLVSGNKWWKLKYNLIEASKNGFKTLVTFGGAFSNHIFATAAAAAELGFKSIGIIRGEEILPLNRTLAFARRNGMDLRFVSREAYRTKSIADQLKGLEKFYLIPEGGSNPLAVQGVREFASKLNVSYDYLCCAVGTGGTLCGLIEGVPLEKKIIGLPILKGGEFLRDEIGKLSEKSKHASNWQLVCDYHFGGYGKSTSSLKEFVTYFQTNHDVPLDLVYTGKMMAGIYDLISSGFFARGSTILAIHTGGLQATEYLKKG